MNELFSPVALASQVLLHRYYKTEWTELSSKTSSTKGFVKKFDKNFPSEMHLEGKMQRSRISLLKANVSGGTA